MNINDTLFMNLNAAEIAKKYRESCEGKQLKSFLRLLNKAATEFLAHYERSCNLYCGEHFDFQCKSHEHHTIALYNTYIYVHGMEDVEQFVSFMVAYELKTFLAEVYEISGATHECDFNVSTILNHCIEKCSDNIYVVDYNKKVNTARESNNILQGEDDEGRSLWMSMHPQEEDKEEQNKEENDDKIISLGMPMQPQEEHEEEQ
jgi:hypothetical protein